ncbi:MAG TPA: RNA-binding protein [Elusimicrobia bacterium]|jgi:RNA recognition motif-containing protein|nr:RNA-binding protein [Elusimicrobiota bacterium]
MLKLFVGNLSFNTTEDELKELFTQVGTVQSVTIIKDKYTNNSKGFGFIEMGSNDEAEKAIAQLNGKELNGRNLSVAEARPPRERRSGGSRGGGYSGGYDRGGGRRRY